MCHGSVREQAGVAYRRLDTICCVVVVLAFMSIDHIRHQNNTSGKNH
jgi:hypothetical protein